MTTKKMLCLVLVVSLVAGVSGLAVNTGETAAIDVYQAFSLCSSVASIGSAGFTISKFFQGSGPDPQVIKKLEEINNKLDDIKKSVDGISKDLEVVYTELQKVKKNDLLQNANNTKAAIDERYAALKYFNSKPKTNQADFEKQKETFETWVGQVLPREGDGMDVKVNQWKFALVPSAGEDESALDVATDQAIENCDTNSVSQDFSATVESTNGVPVVAERPMYHNYNRTWDGGHTEGGSQEPAPRFFFAEGTLRPGYVTYYCVQNNSDKKAEVKVTYMKGDGTTAEQSASIPPHSRHTFHPEQVIERSDGPASDFSALVESTNGVDIVAERPTYFNHDGTQDGGTVDAGCTETSEKYFFAEGSTRPGFDTYFSLMNPDAKQAAVKLTYMKGDSTVAEQTLSIPARTRSTVRAGDLLGSTDSASCDFSTVVESTNGVPIVAERPMYFLHDGQHAGGHSETGMVEPANEFYLAEGTTRPDFVSYICLLNINDAPVEIKVTYMRGDGNTAEQYVTVPARTRSTLKASDILGSTDDTASDFSAVVESTDGSDFLVERPMYFAYKGVFDGGHCEPGATETDTKLHFAEGTVRDNFDSYLCLLNPNGEDAEVKVTFMKGDADTQEHTLKVPAHTRSTLSVDQVYTSPNDLMGVYQRYLENLFWGAFTYQAIGATMITEAAKYDPKRCVYGTEYLSQRFYPGIVAPEVDKFLSSVERLVMSQIDIGPESLSKPSLNDQGYRFAAKTDEVLNRANFLAGQAMNEPEGLRGTLFSTEAVGNMTGFTAGGVAPAGITVREVPYTVKSSEGLGVVEKRYADWVDKGDQFFGDLRTSGKFLVVRYNFSNLTVPQSYGIIDTAGRAVSPGTAICQGVLENMQLEDPSDPGVTVNAKYGHFFAFGHRLGPDTMSSPDYVWLLPSTEGNSQAKAETYPGYRYRLWSFAKVGDGVTGHFWSRGDSTREFNFTDTQDRKAKIHVFLNLGMYASKDNCYDRPSSFSSSEWWVDIYDRTDRTERYLSHNQIKLVANSSSSEYKQDGCRDVALSLDVTLKAGHAYELYLTSKSDVSSNYTRYKERFQAACDLLITGVYLEITE